MSKLRSLVTMLCCGFALVGPAIARADALHDWNIASCQIIFDARTPAGPGYRISAISQTAVYEAVNAITGRYTGGYPESRASTDASTDAAIAAANRSVLSALIPAQQAAIDATYQAAIDAMPDGGPKLAGITLGEASASSVLARRASDGFDAVESYRPYAAPGVYVPTALPLALQWPQRKPWALRAADQFRPSAPPALASERWAGDFNEIKALGSKTGSARTQEQTDVAHFWEATGPVVYFPIVRSVTQASGRELTENARLMALAAQAMDDSLIAVFDAKYTYSFWRPVTAIRNGDIDTNDATERAASWLPLIETPMHPEYPCAHCTVAAAVAAVIEAEVGASFPAPLQGTSPTLPGVTRTWSSTNSFVAEVANARVWSGVHYRNSTEVGGVLGRAVGKQVVSHALSTAH